MGFNKNNYGCLPWLCLMCTCCYPFDKGMIDVVVTKAYIRYLVGPPLFHVVVTELHTPVKTCLRLGCAVQARTVCAGLSLFCLLHDDCCTLVRVSETVYPSWLVFQLVRGIPRVREPFLFHHSLPWGRSHRQQAWLD